MIYLHITVAILVVKSYFKNSYEFNALQVFIIDTRTVDDSISSQSPILKWEITDSKVTSMVWGTLDETIITGHEAGDLIQWDLRVRIDIL